MALYRLFDASGALLYVGISHSPFCDRLHAHKGDKSWIKQVTTQTIEWYETRWDADRAETVAIATEHPRYNIAKLGDMTRVQRKRRIAMQQREVQVFAAKQARQERNTLLSQCRAHRRRLIQWMSGYIAKHQGDQVAPPLLPEVVRYLDALRNQSREEADIEIREFARQLGELPQRVRANVLHVWARA